MSNVTDPYKILGIPRGADVDTVKKAWRKLARELHPDATGGTSDDEFAAAHKAYKLVLTMATISTPAGQVSSGCSCVNIINKSTSYPPHSPWQHVEGPWAEGEDINVSVHVENVTPGGTLIVPLPWSKSCDGCAGSGKVHTVHEPCPSCHGKGKQTRFSVCSICDGTGQATVNCSKCGGSGSVNVYSSYRIVLPQEVENNSTTVIARSGNPGTGGGPPGDLIIRWHAVSEPLPDEDAVV